MTNTNKFNHLSDKNTARILSANNAEALQTVVTTIAKQHLTQGAVEEFLHVFTQKLSKMNISSEEILPIAQSIADNAISSYLRELATGHVEALNQAIQIKDKSKTSENDGNAREWAAQEFLAMGVSTRSYQ